MDRINVVYIYDGKDTWTDEFDIIKIKKYLTHTYRKSLSNTQSPEKISDEYTSE